MQYSFPEEFLIEQYKWISFPERFLMIHHIDMDFPYSENFILQNLNKFNEADLIHLSQSNIPNYIKNMISLKIQTCDYAHISLLY